MLGRYPICAPGSPVRQAASGFAPMMALSMMWGTLSALGSAIRPMAAKTIPLFRFQKVLVPPAPEPQAHARSAPGKKSPSVLTQVR